MTILENMDLLQQKYNARLVEGLILLFRYDPAVAITSGEDFEQTIASDYLLVVRGPRPTTIAVEDREQLRQAEWYWHDTYEAWVY